MNHERLIEEIQLRMGGASGSEAERALCATLTALGEVVRPVDREPLAAALPQAYGEALREARWQPEIDLRAFFSRVAVREGVAVGYAAEHAQAVCRTLWSVISEQARAQLSITLWPELLRPSLHDETALREPRGASAWPSFEDSAE